MSLLSDHPEAGWLYLLENQHMRAVKVGKTDRNPHERADELSKATGVPGRFVVSQSWRVINSAKAEKLAHHALRDRRIAGGEFFEILAVEAVQIINQTLGVVEEPAVEGAGEPAVEGAGEPAGRAIKTLWGNTLLALSLAAVLWFWASIPFVYAFVVSAIILGVIMYSPTEGVKKPSDMNPARIAAGVLIFAVLIFVIPIGSVLIIHAVLPSIGDNAKLAGMVAGAFVTFPISKWLARKVIR